MGTMMLCTLKKAALCSEQQSQIVGIREVIEAIKKKLATV